MEVPRAGQLLKLRRLAEVKIEFGWRLDENLSAVQVNST
jgi:hypothetical protein